MFFLIFFVFYHGCSWCFIVVHGVVSIELNQNLKASPLKKILAQIDELHRTSPNKKSRADLEVLFVIWVITRICTSGELSRCLETHRWCAEN